MLHLSVSINCKGIPRAKQSRTKLKRMFKMFTRCKFENFVENARLRRIKFVAFTKIRI